MTTVYLNGEFVALELARVPVMDRGFLFGDGVYEVIPVYDRTPFRLPQHLARLQASLDGIRLANPHSMAEWASLIDAIIQAVEWPDLGVYLQITRGVGPRDHAFPQQVNPTVFILPMPLSPPSSEAVEHGVSAITAADNRWLRCDLKVTSLLPNVLLRQLSVDASCAETLLIRDGQLIEGSASSVFIMLDQHLLTPPE
jgi:D-alanine transaminase